MNVQEIKPLREKYLTVRQVAGRLGLSRRTIERYLSTGLIPFLQARPGKAIRIAETAIETFRQGQDCFE